MPVAKVYVPEGTLTPDQRREIIKGIHDVINSVEKRPPEGQTCVLINEVIISAKSTDEIAPFGGMKESGLGPTCELTGARNTASRNSSRSNASAWAASTAEDCSVTRFRSDRYGRGCSLSETSGPTVSGTAPGADAR